ncbi:potassium transporter 10-like [Rutidosis leptorrhynchoides]|uniref:potassium transporter 10-like n=1 Tax=Rutidosis leptorrhynchoides TaxID=125765 RepID=UPI003A9A3662
MNKENENEGKDSIWDFQQNFDQPMDEEASKLKSIRKETQCSWLLLVRLAFQSLGVVYGDLGTSPLYVFYNTFPRGINDTEDIIGALSLIIYSLTLVPLIKYVFIVCRASDNGQGGTFALYSLLCRHAKIKTIPNQHRTDERLTTYSRTPIHENSFAATTKRWLEAHALKKNAILVLVLVGTCMVIGDGILTPAISVLSASGGLKVNHPGMRNDFIVVVAVFILVGLFCLQHHGPDKVGWLFAPVVLLWFLLIGGVGIFNICKHDTRVLRAFSPLHIIWYFRRRGKDGWTSLGGIFLSITGTEALFADLAHFPVSAIQLAFTAVVFPCLLLAYCGQAAYLMKNKEQVFDAFYHSIPDGVYWPMFVVATLSAIVASQASISATFSIINQACAHGCFPRVKVVHTSRKFIGQIYVPDINWALMILCILVTTGFKNQSQIGHAYGTAVVIVMLVTTILMILIMILVWNCNWILVFIMTFLSLVVECTYFSAVVIKVDQGAWVPLAIAALFLLVMYVWHYGTVKRYEFEMQNRISMAWILNLGPSLGIVRAPGVGLVYTELASGVPRIFSHFVTNLPAIHSVVIFVCVKSLPVYSVPEEERFLVRRIGPKNYHMFRCVARYGYKDRKRDDEFERKVLDSIFLFVKIESSMDESSDSDDYSLYDQENNDLNDDSVLSSVVDVTILSNDSISDSGSSAGSEKTNEIEFIARCRDAGVAHILGNTVIRARRDTLIYNKICIDYLYAFLRKICREHSVIFNVPHESLLNVGQVFYV